MFLTAYEMWGLPICTLYPELQLTLTHYSILGLAYFPVSIEKVCHLVSFPDQDIEKFRRWDSAPGNLIQTNDDVSLRLVCT